MTRKQRTAQVKSRIISAATRLVSESGMDSVTVANICHAADVSVGSFYHHFSNKDEVLSYYLAEAFHENSLEFNRIEGDDIIANIIRCYELYNQFLVRQGFDFIRNYYTTSNKSLYSRNNAITNSKVNAPVMEKIRQMCRQSLEKGYICEDTDLEHFYYDLTVIEKGVIFDWCICDGSYDLVSEVSRILDAYMRRTLVTPKYMSQFS